MKPSEVLNARQLVLDDFDVDPYTAIHLAELQPQKDGNRPVSVNMQKRVLKRFASFTRGLCTISIETLAVQWHIDERHLRSTVRVLVADGLLVVERRGNHRCRCVHWTEIGKRIPRKLPDNSPMNVDQTTGQLMADCPVATGQLMADCPVATGQGARPKEEQENNQTTKQESAGGFDLIDWPKAQAALADAGVDLVGPMIAKAKANGITAADVIDFVTVAADVGLGPGAIVKRITDGQWPGGNDSMPSIDDIRKRHRDREQFQQRQRDDRERESIRCGIAKQAAKNGKLLSDAQQAAAVDRIIEQRRREAESRST